MPPPQQPAGNSNQTLLELIFALKGLAQTVEFYHQDLSRKIEEESKARVREIESFRSLVAKNSQNIAVLPITMSDRVETLLKRLSTELEHDSDEVKQAIQAVNTKLSVHLGIAERAISQNESAIVEAAKAEADITGRVEVNDKGDVKVQLNSKVLRKIWYGVVVIATGGGAYGFIEFLKKVFG